MQELKKQELYNVEGGFNFSAAFVTALSRGFNIIYSMGQSVGSSIRRIIGGKYCPL